MKISLSIKLAWNSMRTNKKLYVPYILTFIGMIMMFYIIHFLATTDTIAGSFGARTVQMILSLGIFVMAIFSVIFLFFTDSFIVKRRKKEFGLYNILGMDKKNIAAVLLWETIFIALISLSSGLFLGVVFSKMSELLLVNLIQANVTYSLYISVESLKITSILFSAILLLIFLNTVRQLRFSKPIELLHSENTGEKKPRVNWLLGLIGIALLGAAYYIAVTIKNPLSATMWFFVAVVMVIIATYILFIAGAVVICRLLQKNKKYYYKARHFVSVSSMAFRMKRNGAGLASICILSTMVLVMMSSTTCLFIGAQDSCRTRYPQNVELTVHAYEPNDACDDNFQLLQEHLGNTLKDYKDSITNKTTFRYITFAGKYDGSTINVVRNSTEYESLDKYRGIVIIPLSDYNKAKGCNYTLSEGSALMYANKEGYSNNTVAIKTSDIKEYNIVRKLSAEESVILGEAEAVAYSTIYLVVPDFDYCVEKYMSDSGVHNINEPHVNMYYGFDINQDMVDAVRELIWDDMHEANEWLAPYIGYSLQDSYSNMDDVISLYATLFFLGIMLSIVFVFAAVLTMYYKQVSEGYEDQSRFEIMQKVGMTKKDIRKSINSQILTVFFMPLIAAGIHLAFAFQLIQKMLMAFLFTKISLLIITTVGSFVLFALFYIIMYKITANAYYSIVSGVKEKRT